MAILLVEVMKNYEIHISNTTKNRDIILCQSGDVIYGLRKSNQSVEQITFIHNIKEKIAEKGFNEIDRYVLNIEGKPYMEWNQEIYTLSHWKLGRECELTERKDLLLAMRYQALIHSYCKNLQLEMFDNNIVINEPIEAYERKACELRKLRKRIPSRKRTVFDELVLANVDFYQKNADTAIIIFNGEGYKRILQEAIENQTICHGNYTYHNLFVVDEEKVFITDFERAQYNTQLYDVAEFIVKNIKKQNWDYELAMSLLDEYQKTIGRNFSHDDWQVLYAYILFPKQFWKLCNRYYNSRMSWALTSFTHSIEELINQKDKYEMFLENFRREHNLT